MEKPLQPRFPDQKDFIGRLVRQAYGALVDEVTPLIAASHPGVTQSQNQVMILIDREGTRPAELARRAQMTRQSMAETLAGLEARGYVELRADPADRRAKLAVLTPKGRTGLRDGLAAVLAVHEHWEHVLGPRKMTQLMKLLRDLLDGLAAEVAE